MNSKTTTYLVWGFAAFAAWKFFSAKKSGGSVAVRQPAQAARDAAMAAHNDAQALQWFELTPNQGDLVNYSDQQLFGFGGTW